MTAAPCPRCTRGTVTGPNGEIWRCHYCGGTGRSRTCSGCGRGSLLWQDGREVCANPSCTTGHQPTTKGTA